MIHAAHKVWLLLARQRWIIGWLTCLLLGSVLSLSGCGIQGNTPNGGNRLNELDGIVALSTSNAWAVGWITTTQGLAPLIEHWNGSAWSVVPAPAKGDKSSLAGVAARSAQDIWAVGDYLQGASDKTLIEHWNGTAWSVVPSPNGPGDNELRGVAVISATDAWAVGATNPCPEMTALAAREPSSALLRQDPARRATDCVDTSYTPPSPLIEHWDGRVWSLVPGPSLDPKVSLANLFQVVAVGPQDVWAVGQIWYSPSATQSAEVLVEHWDGATWSMLPAFAKELGQPPAPLVILSSHDIWGVASKDIYQIEHWDGTTWSGVPGPTALPDNAIVETLSATAPDDLWATGFYAPPPSYNQWQIFTMHWNGSAWSVVPCPSPHPYPTEGGLAGGNLTITTSTSLGSDDAWIEGYYYPSDTTQLTFLEHWDGHAWSLVPNPNPGEPAPAGQ